MQIIIDIDNAMYASIRISNRQTYWVEQSGAYWKLCTGNAFDTPLKKWQVTKQRKIQQVVPMALAIILELTNNPD